MARLYTNENFRLSVVIELRKLGHDILTVLESGNANQRIPDKNVLQYSIAHNRAVLTLNRRDFIKLHFENPEHFGIIVCSEDFDSLALANRIHKAILDNDPLINKLVRVNKNP